MCAPDKGLFFVSCLRCIRRPDTPILGATRLPIERAMSKCMEKHPAHVFHMVACESQFGAVLHDPGQGIEVLVRDEPTSIMTCFRPGVGEKDKATIDGSVIQRIKQGAGVVRKNANIADTVAVDFIQQ